MFRARSKVQGLVTCCLSLSSLALASLSLTHTHTLSVEWSVTCCPSLASLSLALSVKGVVTCCLSVASLSRLSRSPALSLSLPACPIPNHLMTSLPGCPGRLGHVTGCIVCVGIVEMGRFAKSPLAELVVIRTENVDERLGRTTHSWVRPPLEGYHESRRCSRDTCPESYITKYTGIRR